MTEQWRHNKAAGHGRMLPFALQSLVALILVWLHRARTRRELSQLDDMQMRDAGINAEMLRREAEKPFWQE